MRWFETKNPDEFTDDMARQRKRDYYNMFYSSELNRAVFGDIILKVESLRVVNSDDAIKKNALRDLIKEIKIMCGLDSFKNQVDGEFKTIEIGKE
jgi:hypothetical protein